MQYWSAITLPTLGLTVALATVVAPGLAVAADPLPPGLIELVDGNSTYQVDLLRFSEDQSWLVDGVETIFTDLYFLNLGNSAAPRELRLEDLRSIAFSQPATNRLSATFSTFGANLNFSIDSVLLGNVPGSYRAARQETITLTNTGTDWLDVSLFKYIDYDLQFDGVLDNDTASFSNNTFTQTDSSGALATISVDQVPTAVQISPYGQLLAQLYNSPATGLQPNSGPFVGDATAAFQFDRGLAPGESVVFKFLMEVQRQATSKAVPEPGTAFAFGIVAAGLALLRRRS
ncbi:PEP-CTERM sorting domain-containing protein [Nodosilinea sp. LEGE 06152]|uniref:PEP-CTERM sorting domain-containing protein n=1 Tax=Nodosilinea sp. LEGE 06152 TaxID=2777966 RepID=UPI00187F5D7D|nr:PEP-CTERM sorting domain-containing protein [Nodosilinea sp. LEGE 06152]MBE9158744.1 PEP-CTERM sorting domain-containing protein [Nodosilinea sp. LEGE 06152]